MRWTLGVEKERAQVEPLLKKLNIHTSGWSSFYAYPSFELQSRLVSSLLLTNIVRKVSVRLPQNINPSHKRVPQYLTEKVFKTSKRFVSLNIKISLANIFLKKKKFMPAHGVPTLDSWERGGIDKKMYSKTTKYKDVIIHFCGF